MRMTATSARDRLRAELWPIPTVALLLAVGVGVQLPRFDRSVDADLPGWLSAVVFDGGPGAAQTVLDAISSSLITVTSLTFSLTVVTLQLASSQFSPRLLRTFTSDLFVQSTLALFLATFVYSLAVLRLVRSEDGENAAFVPRLSVTLAFVLVVSSAFVLVLFLAHLTRTIRVESMLRNVHDEASTTLQTMLRPTSSTPEAEGASSRVVVPPPVPDPAAAVIQIEATASGLLTQVNQRALLRAAVKADLVIAVDVRVGDHIVRGLPIARAWSVPADPDAPSTAVLDDLRAAVNASVRSGPERTAAQDVGFGLRQLTDVANKALSPGINDPTTAVHAIGHLAALLCDLAELDLGPRVVHDQGGAARLVLAQPSFHELLDAAISQPRRYGAADTQVLAQLFRLLEALAHRAPSALHHVVRGQLDRLRTTVSQQDFDAAEIAHLATLDQRVCDRLEPA